MEKKEVENLLKAVNEACYDAMYDVHRQARKYGTTVVSEINGVTVETQPLGDDELRERQAKIKQEELLNRSGAVRSKFEGRCSKN